ncbi:hypothetical protein ACFE04_007729 [Oxalis oulophora]
MNKHYSLVTLLCFVSRIVLVSCNGGFYASNEVKALRAFREAIYEDPLSIFSSWNALDSNPCRWDGVFCSANGDYVMKINISGSLLRGFLAPELSQITYLQELILHNNSLLGIIPKQLGSLKFLKVLDLGANQFAGPIPSQLGSLTSIVKINLQSNGLTGKLPVELGNLMTLEEFRLDRNRLRGAVPANSNADFPSTVHGTLASRANISGFCRASHFKVADFSYNFFVGSIPKCLAYLPMMSFQGNCLLNQDPKQRSHQRQGLVNTKHQPGLETSKHKRASKRPTWLFALEIVTGVVVGSLFVIALLTAYLRWNSKSSIIIPWKKSSSGKDHLAVYIDSEMLKGVPSFSRQELEVACEDFSNIIGSSPDSLIYKGIIKGGPEIAVISLCIQKENWTGFLELYFQREVIDLARLNHENTGKFLGYCRESNPFSRMLVFEYASNGTLYEHLHYGEGCQLSWTRRMKIIIGIARALNYLHNELDPPFTLSELKSSAVYLTEDFSPKLVEFESWKTILERSLKNSGTINSQGDICVLPNSLEARQLDIEGNVYAFGVLLLEIISGRPSFCKDKGRLVDWAKEYLDLPEVMSYMVDPDLKHFQYDDLQVICEVVTLCINPDVTNRPSMGELSTILEKKIDTSVSVEFKASSLAWAEIALAS